jgi:hypothetical protein
MADHCRISSEIRSNFGQFEVVDFAFTDDRVGVFSLLTPKVNRIASIRTGHVAALTAQEVRASGISALIPERRRTLG